MRHKLLHSAQHAGTQRTTCVRTTTKHTVNEHVCRFFASIWLAINLTVGSVLLTPTERLVYFSILVLVLVLVLFGIINSALFYTHASAMWTQRLCALPLLDLCILLLLPRPASTLCILRLLPRPACPNTPAHCAQLSRGPLCDGAASR